MNRIYKPEGGLFCSPENKEYLATPQGMERAMKAGAILEGIVSLCDSDLCLHIDLPCAKGIIPPEEAMLCRAGEKRKDIALITRVGKPVAFCILAIHEQHGCITAILSRKQAQERCACGYLSKLREGEIIPARVTHLEPFGAFLDVGCGLSSLLSVDCISVSRIAHPRDRLQVGESLSVVVKSIDRDGGRIYASLKELLGTWEENAVAFSVGQTVTGIIRSVESYGVFVELTPNLAGLAEVRESEVETLRQSIGRAAAVYIKSIVPEKMKIKLVLIGIADSLSSDARGNKALRYYIDPEREERLTHWVYSPSVSRRVVETVFEEEG